MSNQIWCPRCRSEITSLPIGTRRVSRIPVSFTFYACEVCKIWFGVSILQNSPNVEDLEVEKVLNQAEDAQNVVFTKDNFRIAVVPNEALGDRNFGFDPNGYDFAFWIPDRFNKLIESRGEYEALLDFIVAFRKKYFQYQNEDEPFHSVLMGEAVDDLVLQFLSREKTKVAFSALLVKGLLRC